MCRIQYFSSIGDKTVIHTAASLATGMSAKVYIGNNVTVGANCTLYSCHIEAGAQLAPGSVVPPGRLIPAKQLWAGNPVEYVKDLDIAESWANYTYSYVNTALGDAHRREFTMWPSNYLLKSSSKNDVDVEDGDLQAQYVTKNYNRGMVKYYC